MNSLDIELPPHLGHQVPQFIPLEMWRSLGVKRRDQNAPGKIADRNLFLCNS